MYVLNDGLTFFRHKMSIVNITFAFCDLLQTQKKNCVGRVLNVTTDNT